MTDIVDSLARSRMMGRIRSRNTLPERQVRSFLFKHGFRFRLHVRNLPGSPDIVLPALRTAIFVHGCFWHRHPGCRYATNPATRRDFWENKLSENVARDKHKKMELEALGWNPVDLDNISACQAVDGETWLRIHAWGQKTGNLEKWQNGIAHTLAGYAASGWIRQPSVKQAKHGVAILRKAREAGVLQEP